MARSWPAHAAWHSRVQVIIGGVPAGVPYAGAAPTLVNALAQLNVVIPNVAPVEAAVPVVITAEGRTSPSGVTIAVR